jgi:putative DNA primase/helicase
MTDHPTNPDIAALAAEAPPEAADTPAESPKERIARLAALDRLTYDQVREAEARALGCRVTTLDEEVDKARSKPAATHGRSVALADIDPWPHPVSGAELLDDLASAVRRHVAMSDAESVAVAGWIAHTYVFERFPHTPRLAITSPTKRCGKSTLLEVLRATCNRPVKADNISASGTFRTVEALSPVTLLIDEADTFLSQNDELRGILNAGFERNGEVIRVVEIRDEHRPVRFKTFSPCALACIGSLPGTLEDRAIPVALQRRAANETVVKLRAPGARAALHDLARRCARWAADRGRHLHLDPPVPEALGDREGDISVPLLAIADDAGGPWPERMRRALVTLFAKRNADDNAADLATMLLADIKTIFEERNADRLRSTALAALLTEFEERPWPEWRQGKPITAPQVARLLRRFGIRPGPIRMKDGEITKGYRLESFTDAWARYLPPVGTPSATPSATEGAAERLHGYNPQKTLGSGDFEAVTPEAHVTGGIGRKAAENLACNSVTARTPPAGVKGRSAPGWRTIL